MEPGSNLSKFWRRRTITASNCACYRHQLERACFPDHWGPHRFERIGGMFLFPAGQAIHAKSECKAQSSIVCSLRPAAADAWFEGDIEWTNSRLESSLDVVSANVRSLLLRLGDEVRNPGFGGDALIELVVAQLAIELSRYCSAVGKGNATGGLSPWRLKRIDERLADSMVAPSLDELAGLCGMSVRQLARAFQTSAGLSIGSHIAERRIANAKLLLTSEPSVKSVAHKLGFATPSNFTAAFRRATGATPRQFLQQHSRHH